MSIIIITLLVMMPVAAIAGGTYLALTDRILATFGLLCVWSGARFAVDFVLQLFI